VWQGRLKGDTIGSSDAMTTPAITAAEMIIVVSEVNFMAET
jgi:quinolinate synthase